MKKLIAAMLTLTMAIGLAACGGGAASSAASSEAAPASSEAAAPAEESKEEAAPASEAAPAEESSEEAPAEEPAADGDGYVIALANGYFGNAWRSQMIKTYQAYCEKLKQEGKIADYVYDSCGTDVEAQINQVRNFISKGYDAIVINTNSSSALVDICEEAMERGIPVCGFDNAVDSDNVYNVNISQEEFGRLQMDYVCSQIGGKGNIIIVRGTAGTPVDNGRWDGYQEVLANYPDVNVVTTVTGDWDDATTQTELTNAFNAFKGTEINGIVGCTGGAGAYEAILNAGLDPKKIVLAGDMGNLLAQIIIEEGINAIGTNSPPYGVCAAVDVVLAALNGENPPMFTPIECTYFTSENAADYYVPDAGDSFFCGYTDNGNTYGLNVEDVIPDK